MKTLAALVAFVGSIALGLVASYYAGRYAGLEGKAFDNGILAGFVLSIAIGCWLGWKVSRTVAKVRADYPMPVDPEREAAFAAVVPSDEMMAYRDDPSATILCEHLSPIERDLRAVDSYLAPGGERVLHTRMNLRFAKLQARYAFPATIEFDEEKELPGRASDYYQGEQWLRCTQHRCVLRGSAFGMPFPADR